MEEKQKPDNKFKAGAVTATVWANEMRDRQDNKFSVYTVAFERNFYYGMELPQKSICFYKRFSIDCIIG